MLLVLAVGGAHNDAVLLALLALALLLSAAGSAAGVTARERPAEPEPRVDRASRPRAAALALAAGVGVKLTAGLLLPFLVLSAPQRRRQLGIALAGALGLLAVAAVGVIGFGPHALGFLTAIGEQQQLVATHSIPAETARLFGIGSPTHPPRGGGTSGRRASLVALLYALWRTARGADWRVAAGWATVALLVSTAWLLPWYAVWPLPLAAVCGDRRLRLAPCSCSAPTPS